MGYGDEIMAAGRAADHHRKTGRPVTIVGARGHPRWSPVWEGNPAINRPLPRQQIVKGDTLVDGPFVRPYLKSLSRDCGAVFSDWRARDYPGELYLTQKELAFGQQLRDQLGEYLVVEPGIAVNGNPNKLWPWDRWEGVVRKILHPRIVQLSEPHTKNLYWTTRARVESFREACGVLAGAVGAVLPEGGLHHAAAALGIPAVVLFGGHIHPNTTGYPSHINLFTGGTACGQWQPCEHCLVAMEMITIELVLDGLRKIVPGLREV